MKIEKFARLRKQNDMVKIALAFLLTGIGFLVATVWNGVQFMKSTNERSEYILGKYDEITREDITNILDIKGAERVSLTYEQSVNVKYNNKISGITCMVVAKDYMEDLLDVKCDSHTKTFYLNQPALDMLNQQLLLYEEYGSFDENGMFLVAEGTVISLRYASGEAEHATYKTADLVPVEDEVHREEAVVWTYADDVDLTHNANLVRLLLNEQQIDDTLQTRLLNMGFTVENEGKLFQWKSEIEMQILKLEYGLLITLLCILAGYLMLRREVKEYAGSWYSG